MLETILPSDVVVSKRRLTTDVRAAIATAAAAAT
jgi:hypothetical protein